MAAPGQPPRTCCDRWLPDAPVGFLQLQFYLQSVSTNGSIWAFISEPRATVIFQQRVFSWSQGDSRQVQGGAISQNAVSGQCTRSPHIRPISAYFPGGSSLRTIARILVSRLESRSRHRRGAPSGKLRRYISTTC